jgi:quercetin dioxygenase-like cupin family protein
MFDRPVMTVAHSDTTRDDDDVRVSTWTFAPGDATGRHRHEYDYLVVPVTGGAFTVTAADGSVRELVQFAGVSYRGTAGTEHDVQNSSGRAAVFVEIELKR